ncbi:MAG: 2-alkenal reductase [Acidimicrobiia bacterium]|nr:MAG: 2-alkenal reductase [Acidimicrobiia bacterium]
MMEHMSRSGRWSTAVVAVALFLGGAGVGWLVTSTPPAGSVSAAETGATTTTTQTTVTTVESPAADVRTEPAIQDPTGGERIAEVAEAILPSVVQIEVAFGVGSGVIFTPDGAILTAAHVVEGTDEVVVRLADGTRVSGRVLGADSGNDIAVVQIDMDGLPAAPLALDGEPRVGQWVVALGSPWGLEATVTAGIVSAVNQTIFGPDGFPRAMIQTDAAINPGNSGGPLVDLSGRVVGINVSIFSTSGANSGVGFAVPIDRAYRVASALLEGRRFIPGFLGVRVSESPDGKAGAVISEITPGSAAEQAGLQVGDRVIRVGHVPVADPSDLAAQVRGYEAGDQVTLELVRDGETITLEVTLGAADQS